jgi:hypothetical protein
MPGGTLASILEVDVQRIVWLLVQPAIYQKLGKRGPFNDKNANTSKSAQRL